MSQPLKDTWKKITKKKMKETKGGKRRERQVTLTSPKAAGKRGNVNVQGRDREAEFGISGLGKCPFVVAKNPPGRRRGWADRPRRASQTMKRDWRLRRLLLHETFKKGEEAREN